MKVKKEGKRKGRIKKDLEFGITAHLIIKLSGSECTLQEERYRIMICKTTRP